MERKIFTFDDGTKEKAVDPLATLIALMSQDGVDIKADLALLQDGDIPALSRVLSVARTVFSVEPYREVDGVQTGLLDFEVIELLKRFMSYMDELQKKTQSSPTSTASTECQQA